jgi:hypothetical protein
VKGKKHKGEGDSPKKDNTDAEIDCSIPHIMTDAMRYKKPLMSDAPLMLKSNQYRWIYSEKASSKNKKERK